MTSLRFTKRRLNSVYTPYDDRKYSSQGPYEVQGVTYFEVLLFLGRAKGVVEGHEVASQGTYFYTNVNRLGYEIRGLV